MFVAVRAIAPVAGRPPKSGEKIFAIPWPISSLFESCFAPIIPSATTAERRDSMAARIAIETAVGNTVLIVVNEKSGADGVGRLEGILYRSPMSTVSNPQVLLRTR